MSEVRAAKHLGQHFLIDGSIIHRMVRDIALRPNDRLIEIGPGLGALTLPILEATGALTAIEYDSRVIAPLTAKAKTRGRLTLIEADVLTVNFADFGPSPLRIIGNLPYNLTSPILFHCLEQRAVIADMHFMVQKEVAERITARPGCKNYGRLTLMLSQWLDAEYLFDIAPDAFEPPPKVDSAVIRLTVRQNPRWDISDAASFDAIIRTAFGQRRKMLRKTLKPWFSETDMQNLGINPAARPEMLDGSGFALLANALAER